MTDDPFVSHRGLLFTVAYEMLGSAADAEDVVQETWLRWADVDRAGIRDPRAYLVRIVTREALNRLRSVSRRREEYVGDWLHEPLRTGPDVAAELAENVSIAMLTVLETLGPAERAVFVLHEVFEAPYGEIAEALGKTPAAVRQIGHRAREHVAARRPRMRVDRAQQRTAVEKFLAAISTGDVQGLVDVLAPDVVLISDGGGRVSTARRPIVGADRLLKYIAAGFARLPAELTGTPMWLNGTPGALLAIGGETTAAITMTVENGRITRIYGVWNPDKLRWLEKPADLRR